MIKDLLSQFKRHGSSYRELALTLERIANREECDIAALLEALRDVARPFAHNINDHEWETLAFHSDRRGLQLRNIDFITGQYYARWRQSYLLHPTYLFKLTTTAKTKTPSKRTLYTLLFLLLGLFLASSGGATKFVLNSGGKSGTLIFLRYCSSKIMLACQYSRHADKYRMISMQPQRGYGVALFSSLYLFLYFFKLCI